jgi:preprotein translocase, SecE subunit, bacterial
MIKNLFAELTQVTWLGGRKLVTDVTYVLVFTLLLLVYFAGVDTLLAELFKRIFTSN